MDAEDWPRIHLPPAVNNLQDTHEEIWLPLYHKVQFGGFDLP